MLRIPAAIELSLGEADRKALRALSTRVRIMAMSFTNHDEWAGFKDNPQRPMERWFGYCQVEPFGSEGCSFGYFPDLRNKHSMVAGSAPKATLHRLVRCS